MAGLAYYTESALAIAPLVHRWSFRVNKGSSIDMYAPVREEEQVISPQFTRNQEDVSMGRRKKRKQVEEGALAGWPIQHGSPC